MTPLLFFVLVCLSLLSGAFSTVTTVGDQEVLEGQSITVPCHYNPQYTQNVKYWCWGSLKTFCETLARTDDATSAPFSNSRVTIVDDPTQHVFTVTMRELKESDSGWYRCGVEVGDMWTADSTGHLYITVKHGMSVMKSMVSGEEGGNVTIQCLYSEKHRESDKRWCRCGHMSSCKVTDSNGTFSSRSLLISDDRKSMLTVTMRELEMQDAGWYWCGSGEQQVSVLVEITPEPATSDFSSVTTEGDKEVLEGQSITVPCHYNPQYTQNVKYWCWGSSKTFCETLARTDDPDSASFSNARVTIVDDPTQQVFTVTMRELKESDSGWYRCGVEVGGMWTADSTGHLYITVKHGMSVMKSMVSSEEGSNVTIQCLYSEKHRESDKRWCRSGHMSSCKVTDSNGTFSSKSLLISDDRKIMLTVTMRELEMQDAGWYWCGSGEQQVSVHVEVTPKPANQYMSPSTGGDWKNYSLRLLNNLANQIQNTGRK